MNRIPVLVPAGYSAAELKTHAESVVSRVVGKLTVEERLLIVSEIRNALAPIALLTGCNPEDITQDDLDGAQSSLDRLLALATALSRRPSV